MIGYINKIKFVEFVEYGAIFGLIPFFVTDNGGEEFLVLDAQEETTPLNVRTPSR